MTIHHLGAPEILSQKEECSAVCISCIGGKGKEMERKEMGKSGVWYVRCWGPNIQSRLVVKLVSCFLFGCSFVYKIFGDGWGV